MTQIQLSSIFLGLPLGAIIIARATYIALRQPDKSASDFLSKLLFISFTPRFYWKKQMAMGVFFTSWGLINLSQMPLIGQIYRMLPDWLGFLLAFGLVGVFGGSLIIWLIFDWWHSKKQENSTGKSYTTARVWLRK